MPDVMIMEDPFGKASLKRQVAALKSNSNTMRIELPEFEEGLWIKGVNRGNKFKKRSETPVFVIPPVTVLSSVKYVKTRGVALDGIVCFDVLHR